ncbi:MAG: serine/threonine protein phosphatase [Geminicoccaceae bacterium]|jgi:serine/threonine protein phosphatase PrpC|nr:serine/threonine protein phosphatase [Geminicoccaceae bacterium]MDF2781820.1 serine/threonine protein phosphatase [Geminicoccaceae bacterium]
MAPLHLRATAFTHQGAVRPQNEDTIAIGDWITSEPMARPLVLERAVAGPIIGLVADGMGGHAAGEVASRAVAEHLCRRAAGAVDEAGLAALLRAADAELFALMQEQPAWRGMGTTVAGLSVAPERVMAFNVGDSRVYRIDAGTLVQLSTDDTPGPKLADGRTAALTSNLITQTLGGAHHLAGIEPHLVSAPLVDGARYLICSDGLTDLLDRQTIEALLARDDEASATALFEAAMARGGSDNISLILLRLRRDR